MLSANYKLEYQSIAGVDVPNANCNSATVGTTETDLMSFASYPAFELQAYDVLKINANGALDITNSDQTLTVRVYYGASVLASFQISPPASGNAATAWRMELRIIPVDGPGSSVSCDSDGVMLVGCAPSYPGFPVITYADVASIASNTTATIKLTGQWANNESGDILNQRTLSIERLRRS